MMERCPIELWAKIVALACTDGGYKAGRSLSLVSRTMRDTVKPVRFHFVALVDEDSLFALSHVLEGLKLSPVVRHLFVAVETDHHDPLAERAEEMRLAFDAVLTAAASHCIPLLFKMDLVASTPLATTRNIPFFVTFHAANSACTLAGTHLLALPSHHCTVCISPPASGQHTFGQA